MRHYPASGTVATAKAKQGAACWTEVPAFKPLSHREQAALERERPIHPRLVLPQHDQPLWIGAALEF